MDTSKVPDIELISRKDAIQAVLDAYDDEGMCWPPKTDMIDAINNVRPTFIISADFADEGGNDDGSRRYD